MSRTEGPVRPHAALRPATGQLFAGRQDPTRVWNYLRWTGPCGRRHMDSPGLGLQRASRRTLAGTSQREVKPSRLESRVTAVRTAGTAPPPTLLPDDRGEHGSVLHEARIAWVDVRPAQRIV